MTEQEIQSKIINYLKSKDWIVFKLMAVSVSGVPDLICHKGGDTVYIEVKRPGGRLSKIQKYRIAQLRKENITVIVTDNLKEVKLELE